MILVATIVCILAVGWTQYRNGLFTSVAMLMMVFLSGLIAFGFWEPLTNMLELAFQQNLRVFAGCEDFLVLALLFGGSLWLQRFAYQYLAPEMIDEHGTLQHLGAGVVGLLTGYFLSGFLICALQTLPLDERFLDFEPRTANEGLRSVLPPDRLWLNLMRQASAGSFRWKEDAEGQPITFDRDATFELRYLRYRRTTESRPAMPYLGEFDREIGKPPPKK